MWQEPETPTEPELTEEERAEQERLQNIAEIQGQIDSLKAQIGGNGLSGHKIL